MKTRARCRACDDVPDGRRVWMMICWETAFSTFCLFVHVWQSCRTLMQNSQNGFQERRRTLKLYHRIGQTGFEVNHTFLKWFNCTWATFGAAMSWKEDLFSAPAPVTYIQFVNVCNPVGLFVLFNTFLHAHMRGELWHPICEMEKNGAGVNVSSIWRSVSLAVAPMFWGCGFTHYVIQCNLNTT